MNTRSFLLLMVFAAASSFAAQDFTHDELKSELLQYLTQEYGSIENSPAPSGIFHDLVVPIANLRDLDGSSSAPAIDYKRWRQAVYELNRADLLPSKLPTLDNLRNLRRQAQLNHVHPIALLHYDYAKFDGIRDYREVVAFDGKAITNLNTEALTTRTAFAAASLHERTWRGSEVTFLVDPALVFSNRDESFVSYEIDFDDGNGFRSVVPGKELTVSYTSAGEKQITVRLLTTDGMILTSPSRFVVRSLDAPPPTDTLQLTASYSHEGVTATGNAYLYLSDQHTTLTNPVLLSEGFDIDNSLDWDGIYEIMNEENLVEDLRSLGYDAVVLNYDESTTYMQANAYLVVELIQQINALVPDKAPVIVGTSMGGLTCRYAMAWMQQNNMPFSLSTFISLDSPQNGANIPLGLQYWLAFFASEAAEAQELLNGLNSPAARQLLLAHYTDPSSANVSPDAMHTAFMAELESLGDYPQLNRMVSIINGSGTRVNSGFAPGDQLIEWEHTAVEAGVVGNAWALDNLSAQTIFEGELSTFFGLIIIRDEQITVNPTTPWDNAPGGLSNSMEQMDNVAVPYGDLIALHDDHCFIPTISALDLDVTDPFYNIPAHPDLASLSPFDALYYPAGNQDHVDITAENKAWFLFEILGPPAPIVTAYYNGVAVLLEWDPVPDAQSYYVSMSTDGITWDPPFQTAATSWTEFNLNSEIKFFSVASSLYGLSAR